MIKAMININTETKKDRMGDLEGMIKGTRK